MRCRDSLSRLALIIPSAFVLACIAAGGAHAASASAERRSLQIQQQQDALNLHLQQGIRARRYDLGTADERRLDQLQLQQRLEQQQLEQQQVQIERSLRNTPASIPPGALDHRIDAQREIFTQERQLQLQRFDIEQQRLLQSAPRQPLQQPSFPGQLSLP